MKHLKTITAAILAFFCGSAAATTATTTTSSTEYTFTPQTTCEQVLQLSGFDTSATTLTVIKVKPSAVKEARDNLKGLCEAAKSLGASGGTDQMIMSVIAPDMMKLPPEQARIHAFTAMSGWKIGELQRKESK